MKCFVIIVIVICITIYAIYDSKHTSEVEQTFWSKDKSDSSRLKKVNERITSLVNRVETLEDKIKRLENRKNNIE